MKMKELFNDQRGFTLIEMVVVLALIGIIAAGIAMTISQVVAVNSRTSSHMVALRQVQQAGDRISKDALQAGTVVHNTDGDPFYLRLTIPYFDDGEQDQYTVIFRLDGHRLQREYYDDYVDQTSQPDVINTVAQYIVEYDPGKPLEPGTSFRPAAEPGAYVFTVTARSGLRTETRVYDIKPRPGS